MKKFVVIELSGSAGVGKSFLAELLNKEFGCSLKPPKVGILDFFYSGFVLLCSLRTIIFLMRDRVKVIRMIFRKTAFWHAVGKRQYGIIVLDEGPWHLLASSLTPRLRSRDYGRVVRVWSNSLSLPDFVINLKAEPDFISKRRMKRNRYNEKTLLVKSIQVSQSKSDLSFDILKARFPKTSVYDYYIDDSTDFTLLASEIMSIVGKIKTPSKR